MHFLTTTLFSFITFLVTIKGNFYAGDGDVKQLTSQNFSSLVETSAKSALVEFYSPGCHHCVKLTPIWKTVARNLAGHITVAAVNCQDDPLCNKYKVQGVPSIKMFLKDDKGKTFFLDYNGERSANAIIEYAKKYAASFVIKVSESKTGGEIVTLKKFLAKSPETIPRIVFFKSTSMVPSMGFSTLSVDFKNKMIFGIVNSKLDGEKIGTELAVSIPKDKDALVIIRAGSAELYAGELKFTEMKKYLEQLISNAQSSSPSKAEL